MSSIVMMKDTLTQWGLQPQVWDLAYNGYSIADAISLVYKAHTRGNAYRATRYLAMATKSV